MMKKMLALTLALVMVFTLSACEEKEPEPTLDADLAPGAESGINSDAEQDNTDPDSADFVADTGTFPDFADMLALMNLESNVKTEASFSIKFSPDIEISFSVTSEIYEDSGRVSLGWLNPDGTVQDLITVIAADGGFYISTGIIDIIGSTELLKAEWAALTDLIDCDYIKVEPGSIPGYLTLIPEPMRKLMDFEWHSDDLFSHFGDGEFSYTLSADDILSKISKIIELAAENDSDDKLESTLEKVRDIISAMGEITVSGSYSTAAVNGSVQVPSGKIMTPEELAFAAAMGEIFGGSF
jgi:predicted small lipoprotein YifL